MKKVVLSVLVSLAAVLALPLTAYAFVDTVSGHVYQQGTSVGVSGSTVTASCVHKGTTYNSGSSVTSARDGAYSITMNGSCTSGDSFTVFATKDGKTGQTSGTLVEGSNEGHNVAIADVSIALPEMGVVTGLAAIVAAGGAFLVIRRKQVGQQ